MRIYLPAIAVVVIAILWSIYWMVVAGEVETQLNAAKANGLPNGGTLQFDTVEVSGYPFQISALMTNLRAQDPGGSFKADKAEAMVQAWNLSHIILVAAGAQELTVMRPAEDGTLLPMTLSGTTRDTKASLLLSGGEPERIDIDIHGFAGLARDIDAKERTLTAERIQLHARKNELADNRTNVEFVGKIEAAHVVPADDLLLGPDIALIELSARLVDAPLDALRYTPLLRQWAEQGGQVELDRMAFTWGRVDLEAQGSFKLDAARRLEGNIRTLIGGYDDLLNALVATGQIAERDASVAREVLKLLAMAGGDAKGRVPVPVSFRDGSLWLGIVRVAPLQPLF